MTQIAPPTKPAITPRRTAYRTPHTARRVQAARYPGVPERWRVSWLPDELLSRAEARLALALAEALFDGAPRFGGRGWRLLEQLASEFDLTAGRAIDLIAEPPHLLERRFHVMSLGCWCRPRPTLDGARHVEPGGREPVFAATDNDPIADDELIGDHR